MSVETSLIDLTKLDKSILEGMNEKEKKKILEEIEFNERIKEEQEARRNGKDYKGLIPRDL